MAFSLMESRRRILLNTPHVESASGDIATFSTDMAAPLKSCVVTINPVQSGTGDPSPDNVRPISGWTGCSIQDNSLPAEYQKVEYLESQSDCYILTDYYPTGKTTYKSKGAITSSGWVFGSRTARAYGDSMGWLLTTSSNYKTFRVDYAELQLDKNYTTATRRFRVESSYNDGTWSYVAYTGDTDSIFEQRSVSERTFTGVYPLALFGLNNGGTISKYVGVKLFYLTLMEDNQITADFIPCYRKSDNTPGMYDIVGRKFYTNSGTGTFVTGPDISSGTTISISWQTEAGTVYGGTLNVLTGKLTVDKWGIDLGTLTWSNNNITKHIYQAGRGRNPAWEHLSSGQTAKAICSQYVLTNSSGSGVGATDYSIALGTGSSSNIYVRDSTYGDAAEFQSAASGIRVVYPLAAHIEYTLTPQQLSALKGVNSIWADCGPVSIKYWTH